MPCSEVDRTGRAGVSSIRSSGECEWATQPVRADYLPYVDEILLA